MKLCRFQPLVFQTPPSRKETSERPEILLGRIEQDSVRQLEGDLFSGWSPTERIWPLSEVKFLPPSVPSKIVCVGRNYREHAAELGNEIPAEPLIFLKPPSAILAPEEAIVLPAISKRVDYEGEIAAIIGRTCSKLGRTENPLSYVAGFTCLNDVTARDLQKSDGQWTRGKGFDTFCPFGPVLETELALAEATIETYVNGKKKQSSRAAEMIFSVDVIIGWISHVMTLVPGDVIATGTPSGIAPLAPGDVVEVVVGGVGTLRNPVVAESD
jgi:2-keto-4-pentenoate hydratase/2-oxohepta-3-ene-1,7-dioic acid hydratase in catechol pathway